MLGRRLSIAFVATLVLVLAVTQSAAAAPKDRPPKPTPTPVPSGPTAPSDLRITGLTSYSVGLSWTAATSKAGIQAYLICCAGNSSERTPGDATTWTYRSGLEPGRTFTLYVVALDNDNRTSQNSPFVTFTTPPDTTAPSKPAVQVSGVGDTWVSLSWSSIEEGPVWFTVSRDGSPVLSGSRATSGSFASLKPRTAYTFTVEARDLAGNRATSDPVTVTTTAPDTSDVTGPSTPGLFATFWAGDGETWLQWSRSVDDTTPQPLIVYEVYVNGVFDHSLLDYDRTVVYGVPQSRNTYTVIAVDTHGNRSAPATIVVDNF